jgi:hypothetical protein
MRSIREILNLVIDSKITTKEQAAEIIAQEVADRAGLLRLSKADAKADLLDALGFATGYMTNEQGDKVCNLFETQHPQWGRTHPTPEEALRMGEEAAAKRQQKEKD